MSRRIAHLDMDAFFASVELLAYPELAGLPVAVGGRRAPPPRRLPDGSFEFARLADYSGRGVLTTATYAARALGLSSGMGIMQAARLAPRAILLPANFEAYREASQRFKAAVAAIAPRIEDRGIDEIYIDLGELAGDEGEVLALARRIKAAVRAATGLTCSLGIAPNKLLAKICSDLDKPDGITLLAAVDIPARLWPLPVCKINGIGPKASEKLAALGIHAIGELAAADPMLLQRHFGRTSGLWLHQAAQGIDDSPLVTERAPKSVSRETTFERDLSARADRDLLRETFNELCLPVAADLERKGVAGRTIGIKLRYADFTTVTRDLTLPEATADPRLIRRAAGECLRRTDLERRLRLLGVRVGGLAIPRPPGEAVELAQTELPLR
ncbi:MAG: DNA polymerase IV [Betaproteobacteria bacterium HGW-Betaproteobacteria-11]|nr:MAG: DNA polymerase IV [Betaproteobacteria bacterium HGW-Betaproteobacteria-11]